MKVFSSELADVPGGPCKAFFILGGFGSAGGASDDLIGSNKVDAGLVGMVAAADEEVDVVAVDMKFG